MTAATSQRLRSVRHSARWGNALRMTALCAAVLILWFCSLMIGDVFYSPSEVWAVLTGHTVPGASFAVGDLRLPRATVGAAVGAAFGVSGALFQTLLRNQLASPDIIGISSAASAAGATAIVFFHWGTAAVSATSLIFSLVIAAAVFLLVPRPRSGPKLILIGIGVGAVMQSWTSYVLSRAAAWDAPTAVRWLTGSLNSASFEQGWPALIAAAAALSVGILGSNRLALLRFGDDTVEALGVRSRMLRPALLMAAVLFLAAAASVAGPIAFAAFMACPIASRLFPAGTSLILPSGLVGAALILTADAIGQFAFGTRYPAGVVTGALGAPLLIALLIRARK